jgi:fibronectin-binding autotransporter adhesin
MNMRSGRATRLLLAVAAVVTLCPQFAAAATWYWDTTTTGLWTDGANWSDNATSGGTTGTVPTNNTATDIAFFNQSTVNGGQTVQLDANRSIAGIIVANTGTTAITSDSSTARLLTLGASGITVNAGAGAVALGGATSPLNLAIALNQSFNVSAATTLQIVGDVSRAAADTTTRTLTLTGSGAARLDGVVSNGGVSGSLALAKSGSGKLTLTGANTYSGATSFSGGTILVGVDSVGAGESITSGAFGTGVVNLASGTQVIASNGAMSRVIGNQIVNAAGVSSAFVVGDGVNNGSIELAGGYAHAFVASLRNNLTTGGTLTISGPVLINDIANRTLNLNLAGTGATIITGTISNGAGAAGGVTKTGSGSLSLLAANTYRGNTSFANGGTLWLGASSVVQSGTIVSGPVGLGALSLGDVSTPTTTISGNDSSTNRTIANRVNLDFGTYRFGDGVNNASLEFTGAIYNYWGAKTLVNNLTGTSTLTFSGTFFTDHTTAGRTITFDGGGNTLVSGPIINNPTGTAAVGAVTKTGVGTLTLSGTNLYSGATTVNGGAVVFAGAWAISGTAARPITANAAGAAAAGYAIDQGFVGKVVNTSAGVVALAADSANNLDFSAAGANMTAASLGAVGSATYSGVLTPSGTAYRLGGGGGTLTVSGQLTGGNTLTVGGPTAGLGGTVALTNIASSFTGKTTIQAGTLEVAMFANTSAASPLGAPTTTANGTIDIGSTASAAVLRYTGTGHSTNRVINLAGTTGGATIEAAGSGAVVFTSAATATGAGAKTITLGGTSAAANSFASIVDNSLANPTSLTKAGVGRWVLTGSSGYTGATTVSGGTLQIGNGGTTGALSASSAISGAAGATLAFNRSNTVTQGTHFNSLIGGAINVAQVGSGTLVLNGANTYTGTTRISAGVLALGATGSFGNSQSVVVGDAGSVGAVLDLTAKSGTFAFGSGQMLGGGGVIKLASSTVLDVRGTFSPGNSPGLFTFDGGTTLLSGTTIMEMWGTSRATLASHGTDPYYDAVDIINSGVLNFNNSVLTLDFNQAFANNSTFSLFAASGASSLLGNFGSINVTGSAYTGLAWTSGSSGVWTSSATTAGQTLSFDSASGVLVIVPEPAGLAIAGIGIVLGGLAIRRRARLIHPRP